MTIDNLPLKDADRIRFHIEAETHEDEYYEVRCCLPALVEAPPGPRPPPSIAKAYPHPTHHRIAIRGEQEAEVLI